MAAAKRPEKWKVLAVFCGSSEDTGCGAVQEFADLSGAGVEVHVVRSPTLKELSQHIQSKKPNLLYLSAGIVISGRGAAVNDITLKALEFKADGGKSGPVDGQKIVDAVGTADIDTVYVDAKFPAKSAEALRSAGVRHVVFWDDSLAAPALIAAFAGKAFFVTLRNSSSTSPEAYQVAEHAAHVHCLGEKDKAGRYVPPLLPKLVSSETPELPDNTSIPQPTHPSLDLSRGILAAVPGWAHVRLLAPHADLRLLVCGHATLVDAHRLGFLGEALRALLVMEMRTCKVISMHPPDKRPSYLPEECQAVKCSVRSSSGARVNVILGGPREVVEDQLIVEHALRHTLVADSLALQMKLPPEGVAAPIARSSEAVAGGTPVVEALATTSLWAATVLKALSQDASFRGLVALGVAAIGGSSTASFAQPDSALFGAVVDAHLATPKAPPVIPLAPLPAPQPGPPAVSAMHAPVRPFAQPRRPGQAGDADAEERAADFGEWLAGPDAERGSIVDWSLVKRASSAAPSDSGPGSSGAVHKFAEPLMSERQPRASNRPPLAHCIESEFLDDLCAFLIEKKGKTMNRATFPDAILNGVKLDVFALYKEVVTRGGFKLGNGINWKSQVFTQMRNWTPVNNMTGVGNALKRHYQVWLQDYENEHPEDITGDSCALCGGGEESGSDWISCDSCQAWVHFSCDRRAASGDLGAWREYATGENGRSYICERCSEGGGPKKQRTS